MTVRHPVVRLIGPPEADGEYVALRNPGADEEIVHLHDYERLYRVPGLYEHIVQELLGCRSPEVAADALAEALDDLALDPSEVVLFDLGAGTGIVGELASAAGISTIVGLDALDAARTACLRDRPGVYADYLVGDLASSDSRPPHHAGGSSPDRADLRRRPRRHSRPRGGTDQRDRPAPGRRPVVFTIDERWTGTDGPGGFRTVISRLLASGRLRLIRRSRFEHRVSTSGKPIYYELVAAVTGE